MSDDNFHHATAVHAAAYASERRAERLAVAQAEVRRAEAEVIDRRDQILALPADDADPQFAVFGEALTRSRLATALQVATQRLEWAQEALRKVESE